MKNKRYFSERHNLRERDRYSEQDLSDLFVQTYHELLNDHLFEELIGFIDNRGSRTVGLIASNYDSFIFKRLGKRDLVPTYNADYYEEDVFDLVELFYDYVSKPIERGGKYDKKAGKIEFREEMNNILNHYEDGYELTKEGYIRKVLNNGLENLIDSKQGFNTNSTLETTVEVAKRKFFHYKADESDKRGAIIEVGRELESLKKTKRLKLNNKDESDLFNVLNSFNLRHNRPDQQVNYDKDIFYPWIFYNLLSALDASSNLQKKVFKETDF